MTHFIENNTGAGDLKENYRLRPDIPSPKKITADDWSTFRQALLDVQSWWRGGAKWYGLAQQSSNPNPSGVTNYVYLDSNGRLSVNGNAVAKLSDG